MFKMYMIALVLVSSSTWYQTNAGRLQHLERKLHAIEMSVIRDIHQLKEDIHQAKEKMEEVLASMNSTTSLPLDTNMTEEDEHKLAERIESKMEALVVQQLKRVKRAFVSAKVQPVAKQQEQESNFTTHAQIASETMTKKPNSSINSFSSALLNVNTVDEVFQIEEAVNRTIRKVERSVNSSLLDISEKLKEHLNTITDKLENGISKMQQIVENSRNNEFLHERLQLVKSIQFTSILTLPSHAASVSRSFIFDSDLTEKLKPCLDFRTHYFEECRVAYVHIFSELIDLGKRIRLGSSSKIDGGVQGRLELFFAGEWGTVCANGFGSESAKVACRMLGYLKGDFQGQAYFGQGSGPILFNYYICSGDENSLFDCPVEKGSERHKCGHSDDVGVICRN